MRLMRRSDEDGRWHPAGLQIEADRRFDHLAACEAGPSLWFLPAAMALPDDLLVTQDQALVVRFRLWPGGTEAWWLSTRYPLVERLGEAEVEAWLETVELWACRLVDRPPA